MTTPDTSEVRKRSPYEELGHVLHTLIRVLPLRDEQTEVDLHSATDRALAGLYEEAHRDPWTDAHDEAEPSVVDSVHSVDSAVDESPDPAA